MDGQTISGEPGLSRAPIGGASDVSRIIPYVQKDKDGQYQLYLAIDNIHCAGCIKKIEGGLLALPQITSARLNFSTRRLAVSWRGSEMFAEQISRFLSGLGYNHTAFDAASLNRTGDKEAKHLLICLGVAGFATGNIMLMSFALWTSDAQEMGTAVRDLLHWISALIAIPAIAFSGRPFFTSAFNALKAGRTNMDVPISVGLVLTTGMSLFELATHGDHAYFDSAVMLMFFLLVGRYLDYLARANARKAADNLLSLMSGTATLIEDGHIHHIKIREIKPDMNLLIAMGEYIPADCVIIDGNTDVDTSLVTGESLPSPAPNGSYLLSGVLNISSPIKVRIVNTPEDSQIGSMVRLMEKAEQSQAMYVRLADRVARLYTPVVHSVALLTFAGWMIFGHIPWQEALLISATVLIITCPCALALAVPIVQVIAVSTLMKRGIMVRAGDALERLAKIDTIIFDKTGTLTRGHPVLVNAPDIDMESFSLAASMAAHSRHPLSKALSQAYAGKLEDMCVEEIPGSGLRSQWQGLEIRLGRRTWATDSLLPDHDDMMEIVLSVEGRAPLSFLFRDDLREDAVSTIASLHEMGFHIHLLSGDKANIVSSVAARLNISSAKSHMTPEDKYNFLEDLRRKGHSVMMVGDGINDAPVLAGADVSASPSCAIDIARNAASVVLTGDKLSPLIGLIKTAQLSQKLVMQNFGMTVVYNLLAIPAAIAGLITPLIAAAAMSLSSLAVILNAFRVRRKT